jgi:hypothetical protein
MAVPFIKIVYTTPSGTEYDITEFTNLQSKRGLQIKDAKCDLAVNSSKWRYKNGGESIFVEDGTVEIYADYTPITEASSQLVLSGQIQEITQQIGERGAETRLSISDKTTLLLSGLWSKDYTGAAADKVDNLLRNIISHAPSAESAVTTANVVASTTEGSAFPTVEMSKVMKPIYEWLTDLSQPSVTGEDKAYLFYVDKDNDLHWFYPSATVSASVLEGSTTEIYSVSMRKSQDELVNMIIYNAGQDLKGNGILWYYYDATSKSNKLRMKYQPMIDIGRDLFQAELTTGKIVESTGQGFHYQGKDYDNAAAYPFAAAWEGNPSVTSDDNYNDQFRTQAKEVADDKSSAITKAFSGLRWKGKMEIKGTNSYVAGDLLYINLPTLGILAEPLRVWDVQQSFGTDGWITGLELREDDEAI